MTAALIWVVTTDGERARIFQLDKAEDTLREVKVIHHAETSVQGMVTGQAATSLRRRPEQEEPVIINASPVLADFAKTVGAQLDLAKRRGRYERLVMIAPQNILPRLLDSLSPRVHGALIAKMEDNRTDDTPAVIRSILPM